MLHFQGQDFTLYSNKCSNVSQVLWPHRRLKTYAIKDEKKICRSFAQKWWCRVIRLCPGLNGKMCTFDISLTLTHLCFDRILLFYCCRESCAGPVVLVDNTQSRARTRLACPFMVISWEEGGLSEEMLCGSIDVLHLQEPRVWSWSGTCHFRAPTASRGMQKVTLSRWVECLRCFAFVLHHFQSLDPLWSGQGWMVMRHQ